jgi:hypothetical protein
MKIRFFYIAILMVLSANIIASPIDSLNNPEQDISGAVASAIKSGDAKTLALYFNSSVDLTVPGSDGTYSKSQAEMIVKNFFSLNKPVSFSINQNGNSSEGSHYSIGTLVSAKAKFRTYFLVKKIGGKQVITQLQFEQE